MKNIFILAIITTCLYLILEGQHNIKRIDNYKHKIENIKDSIRVKDSIISKLKLKRDDLKDTIYIDRLVIKKIKIEPVTLPNDSLILKLKEQYN